MSDRNYYQKEYAEFRRLVRLRDNRCCRWPGCGRKKRLQVHHILRWYDCPHLRFDINNGITLCKMHHSMINGQENHFVEMFINIICGKNV